MRSIKMFAAIAALIFGVSLPSASWVMAADASTTGTDTATTASAPQTHKHTKKKPTVKKKNKKHHAEAASTETKPAETAAKQ